MPSLYEFTASLPSAAAATVNPAGPIHSYDTVSPCPACGAPNGTCTGEHHMAETETKSENPNAGSVKDENQTPAGSKRAKGDAKKLSNGADAASAEPNTVASGAYTPEDVVLAAGANADKPGDHVGDQSSMAFGGVVNQPENTLADGDVKVKTKAVSGSDDLVEVTEDVVQEFYALGAKRPSPSGSSPPRARSSPRLRSRA
jgi:hypothetical protein